MRNVIAFSICLSASFAVCAGELLIHTVALHGESGYRTYRGTVTSKYLTHPPYAVYSHTRYNNTTLGVGYVTDTNWMAGIYYNSYHDVTVYAGRKFPLFNTNFSLIAGVGTGYRIPTGRSVTPLVALNYQIAVTGQHNIHITVIPKYNNATETAAMFSIGHRF